VNRWKILPIALIVFPVLAQTHPATQPAAPSRIVAVTLYQTSALVTREVAVPAGAGAVELVVGPLPGSTVNSSLYSEGTDGLRVLTTRYRVRAVPQNTQEEVRRIDDELKEIQKSNEQIQAQIASIQQAMQLLTKLESFTSASLKETTEKGNLNADSVQKLAQYIMDTLAAKSAEQVKLQQQLVANNERTQFLQRQRAEVAGASDKSVREAVIVVDRGPAQGNANGNRPSVRLNYLVSSASWRPQYKLRAAKDPGAAVQVEYLAAIFQQSGEDWGGVDMVLSTAQPLLNAAPPELSMLEVAIAPHGSAGGGAISINGSLQLRSRSDDNRAQAKALREEAQSLYNSVKNAEAERRFNDAAAVEQSDEILSGEALATAGPDGGRGRPAVFREGQSVTFHLDRKLTVPWRDDEQLIEVARLNLKPDYFYKAVPVLTQHVYRLATLTNDSPHVLLPGEATMYIGTDFVGRASLPLVVIGEQFTAGFGVDPQVQVSRQLASRTRSMQGGNQVLTFDYRIAVSSYKAEAVKLQLWDRLPHSEGEAVNVTLTQTSPELSKDGGYVRDERAKNLLRWDLTLPAHSTNETATAVTYQFKLEFDRNSAIQNFLSK
jgi:hypothetical protein